MNNKLFPPKDNKVIIEFTFTGEFSENGLNNFTEIVFSLGGESYSTLENPSRLYLENNTTLVLDIGEVTGLNSGVYFPEIIGYNTSNYNDGYTITSECNNRLGSPIIVCR